MTRKNAAVQPPRGGAGGRSHDGSRLRPRVLAAIEEAILLVVVRGFAVRFDRADLGERGLHRRPLVDRLEPAREIGIVLPLHALGVVIARPREGGDVGDRVFVAAEIRRLASRFSSTS